MGGESFQDQKKYYGYAKDGIRMTNRLYGNPDDKDWIKWQPRYDDLLKQIQGELKEPRIGLKAFEETQTTSAKK